MSDQHKQLSDLYARMEELAGTLPLTTKAEDIIPGEGLVTAEVLCIGEAPGAQEAKDRRPFVGRSGKLLRKTLTESGIQPESVYIANIIKARPPENRDPSLDEIEAYRPFLDQEIAIIKPKLIVTLGRFSMAAFLSEVKISEVHGKLHKVTLTQLEDCTMHVLPLYHPAAGLRNGKVLAAFKEDIAKIPKILAWLRE